MRGFQSSKTINLKYWVVEEGLIVTLLGVKQQQGEFWRGWAGVVVPSGHSSGLGYVGGGQAGKGHLHCGAFTGASLGWRCFGGA